MILGQSFGGVVALAVAARYPDLPSKLIVSSSLAKFRPDRAFPMFEQLGGPEVREVAERHFRDLTDETAEEFLRVCLPVYNTTPADPDVIARTRLKLEVGNHFFRNEGFKVDLLPELSSIRCPTLVLARRARPDHARRRLAGHCGRDPAGGAARLRGRGPRRLPRQARGGDRGDSRVRRAMNDLLLSRTLSDPRAHDVPDQSTNVDVSASDLERDCQRSRHHEFAPERSGVTILHGRARI